MTSRASTPATAPLHWWTARDLAAAIRRRDLSAREVVAWHLDRIEDVNPRINAIVSLAPEAALAAADVADRRAGAGEPLGPLHGLPIAIPEPRRRRILRSARAGPRRDDGRTATASGSRSIPSPRAPGCDRSVRRSISPLPQPVSRTHGSAGRGNAAIAAVTAASDIGLAKGSPS